MSKRIILLQALTATPNDLVRMVRGVEETAVLRRPAPDQWSVAMVLVHLAEVEVLYLRRLQRVMREERPFLPAIHPEIGSVPHNPAQLVDSFAAARAETLAFLKELKPGQWQRAAIHETWGEVKLRYLVQHLVDHDTQHLNQILEILQTFMTPDNAA